MKNESACTAELSNKPTRELKRLKRSITKLIPITILIMNKASQVGYTSNKKPLTHSPPIMIIPMIYKMK